MISFRERAKEREGEIMREREREGKIEGVREGRREAGGREGQWGERSELV